MTGSGVSMGTAYASIEVKLDQMRESARVAPTIMKSMAENVEKIAAAMNRTVEQNAAASAERRIAIEKRATDALAREAKRAADAATKHFGDVARSISEVGQKLTLGIAVPVAAAGAAVLKAAMDMDTLKRSLQAVTSGTEQFNREMRSARDIARLPGLGLSEALAGLVKLQSGGFKEGLAVDTLKQVGNALATVGHGKAELAAVTEQISQMSGKSKILAEDVRLISQYIPQFRQAMQSAFGTGDTERIGKMGLSVEEFFVRVNAQLEKLPRVTGGAKNAVENFSDASKVALSEVGNAILPIATKLLDTLTPAIEGAGKAFSRLPDSVKETVLGTTGIVALMSIATLAVGKFMETWALLKTSAATPVLFKITVVAVGFAVLKELIDFRMKQIEEAEERQAAAARSLPSDATRNMRPFNPVTRTGTMGYQQFQIKPAYGKSVHDTLAAINAEQNRLAVTTSRRNDLSRDASAIIRDEEKRLQREASQRTRENAVSLTGAGREAQLRNALKQIQEIKDGLLNKIGMAKTKQEYNVLGSKLESARTREMSLTEQLKAYDPKEIANRLKEAAEKRKRAIEANTEAEIQVLQKSGKKLDAARKKAQLEYARDISEGVTPKVAAAKRTAIISDAYEDIIKEMDAKEKKLGDLRSTALKMTTRTATDEMDVLSMHATATLRVLADVANEHMQIEAKTQAALQRVRDEMDRGWELYLRTQPEPMEWFKPGEGLNSDKPIGPGMPKGDLPFDNPLRKTTKAQRDQMREERELAIERVRSRVRRSLGGSLGVEVAYGFLDGFARSLEKAFGKSDIGKIFARGLMRWLDRETDNLIDNLFYGIGKALGRKGTPSASAGAASIAQGAGGGIGAFGIPKQVGGQYAPFLMAASALTATNAKKQKNAMLGGLLGMGAAALIPGGLPFMALAGGLGSLFGGLFDEGGVIPGPRGKGRLILAHAGETVLPTHKTPLSVVGAGGMGAMSGVTLQFTGDHHYHNNMDAERVADVVTRRLEHVTLRKMPARIRR